MPPTLPIDLSNFPAFQTRKALLVIDLQNEFLSPTSSLFVSKPEGYLERSLDVVKRFRESGAGDVFWIRTQYDANRPTANARIVTSSKPSLSARSDSNSSSGSAAGGPRARRKGPEPADDTGPSQDADPEAFLSFADAPDTADTTGSPSQKVPGHSMLPGSFGSELTARVAAAINAHQDLVIAKSHYSAFESTQLLTRLRTRFITELYIFGALTNISIYATALDAARHGLTLTIVEDCCGYRDAMRHNNALQGLIRLTGCDTLLAEQVLETLPAPRASQPGSSSAGGPPGLPPGSDFAAAIAAITATSHGPPGVRRGFGTLPVRPRVSEIPGSAATPPSIYPRPARPSRPVASAASSSSPSSQPPPITPQSIPRSKPVLSPPSAAEIIPAEKSLTVAPESKSRSKSKKQEVSPAVLEDGDDQAIEPSSDATIEPALPVSKSTTGTVSTSRQTDGPPSLDVIDVGGITPDDGENEDSDPDDSFIPVLPSRAAKLLEYSRLRAKHQAEASISDNTDESVIRSRLQYKKVSQPVRVRREASKPVKDTKVSSGSEKEGVSQPAKLKAPTSATTLSKESSGVSLDADKKEIVSIPEAVKVTDAPSSEVKLPKKTEQKESATTTPQPETPTADPVVAEMPNTTPKEASTSELTEAPKVTESAAASQSTQKDSSDKAPKAELTPPSPKTDKSDPVASIAESPLVPVDLTKKPAATAPICAGDTIIYHNVLPAALEEGIYERLRDEVQWQRMSHQGGEVPRLVCVQGGVDKSGDGEKGDANEDTIPVYRHPADESPPLEKFSPTVRLIKEHIEAIVGHPLNHALIQHYRSGNDYISEHSDKTLDIVPGSYVCNMSLGAERMMIFRTKRLDKDRSKVVEESASTDIKVKDGEAKDNDAAKDKPAGSPSPARQSCRVQLPHNSLCRMGLKTNEKWLHAIRQDKRADRDKSEPEMAFGGGRISLTFRQIGTFLNKSETLIWGQGAVAKMRAEARPVINGQSDEAIAMLRAFGTENHSSSFDWARHYGAGFDVLHMSSAPRFFASSDKLVNNTIQLLLTELGISYARGSLGGKEVKDSKEVKQDDSKDALPASSLAIPVRFVDNDRDRCTVQGLLAILLYVDSVYGTGSAASKQTTTRHNLEIARVFTRLQQALLFQDSWRAASASVAKASSSTTGTAAGPAFSLKSWKEDLATWNACLSPTVDASKDEGDKGAVKEEADKVIFIAGGPEPSLADYAVFPILHDMEQAFTAADEDTDRSDCKDTVSKESKLSFQDTLKRLGLADLARYYTHLKARASFERVMLAGDK